MSRLVKVIVAVVLAGVVGGVGFWAGRVALVPPSNPLAEVGPLTYTVADGQVGKSLSFVVQATWELSPVGRNGGAGVVTSMPVGIGDVVSAGDVLYSVDLRPVVVAEGVVPAFRDLSVGMVGPDVAQVQGLLTSLGFFDGDERGVFDAVTAAAVKGWQESLGVEADGVVRAGDVVFVPELPVRVAFSDVLAVGARVSGGEQVVLAVPADPMFVIPLSVEQRSLVPLSAQVKVTFAEGVWDAVVVEATESPLMNQLSLVLRGADGGPVCGDVCARWVSLTSRTDFRAQVVVIPDTTGPVVPVSAIGTDAANRPFVTLTDGTQVPVTVVASSQGTAVVDGIDVGTVVVLPYGEVGSG